MALCVPDRIPDKASTGEKWVFDLLRTLPDGSIVYYEPKIDRRCPDFVVISPTLGLLVVEVKGWYANWLAAGGFDKISLNKPNGPKNEIHPLEQARQYMFRLMKHCEEHLWSRPLLHPDGAHKGRFFFPFGHVAILSNITRQQLATRNQIWCTLFPPQQVVTKDELQGWSSAIGGNLLNILGRHFHPSWPFPPLTREQVNLLRAIIHPEILISVSSPQTSDMDDTTHPLTPNTMPGQESESVREEPSVYRVSRQDAGSEPKSPVRRLPPAPLMKVQHPDKASSAGATSGHIPTRQGSINSDDARPEKNSGSSRALPTQNLYAHHAEPTGPTISLKILDLEQELAARAVGSGHRLLFGVAGSGKTVVLISRARLLAQVAGRRVLFLCFNVPLASMLQHILRDLRDQIDVMHFDALAKRYGSPRAYSDNDDHSFGARFLAHLDKIRREPKYDAVLIDEAQDFDPTWFQCALRLMRDPQNGDLLIVGDGNQGIYGQRPTSWSSIGINGRGRTTYLKHSYRSSKEIIEFAAPFARTGDQEDNGVSPVAIDPAQARRSTGIPPLVIRCENRSAECEQTALIIESLLEGRFGNHQLATPLQASDIGIILPSIPKENDQLFAEFRSKLTAKELPWIWLSDRYNSIERTRICESGIKIQNIWHSKGLQYRAVIFLWADQLPNPGWQYLTPDEQRMLFYVALTRAEDFLAVTCSGRSAFLDLLSKKTEAIA
jgi:hypothetical protein